MKSLFNKINQLKISKPEKIQSSGYFREAFTLLKSLAEAYQVNNSRSLFNPLLLTINAFEKKIINILRHNGEKYLIK
jgi:hypothetical protein